jgi:O-antigen/teichoic acid export membrane protein
MRQLAKVADNVVALLVRQVLTWSLTAVLMIFFLPRLLGDVGLGKITFAIAVVTILLVVTNLGTATFTVKQVALDHERVSDILWHAYALRLVMGLLAGAVVVLAAHVSGLDSDAKWVLSIASIYLIVVGLDAAQIAALQGLENMRRIAMAEVAGKATLLALGITVLETGHGVVAYALAMLCGALVGFFVNFFYLARRHLRRPSLSPAIARYLLIGGLPFLMTGAIMQFYTWSDTLTLRFLTRDAVVGWYGAANQLYATMNFVPLVLITALLPALTRFHAQDKATMRLAVEKGMLAVLTTGIPLAVGSIILSGELIGFLRYPSEFQHSVPLLATLALTLPVTGSLMLVGTVVIAADKQKEWAITIAITAVISLAINVPFILFFDRVYGNGALGVTLASVLSEALMLALGIRLLPEGIMGRSVLIGLVRCLAASAAMLGAMVGVKLLHDPGFLALVTLGAVVYFSALLAVRGITIDEVKYLLRAAFSRGEASDETPAGGGVGLTPRFEREGA